VSERCDLVVRFRLQLWVGLDSDDMCHKRDEKAGLSAAIGANREHSVA
jgi:hypothetical protein